MRTLLLRFSAGALALGLTGLGAASIEDARHTPVAAWLWMIAGMVLAYYAFTGRWPFLGDRGRR